MQYRKDIRSLDQHLHLVITVGNKTQCRHYSFGGMTPLNTSNKTRNSDQKKKPPKSQEILAKMARVGCKLRQNLAGKEEQIA